MARIDAATFFIVLSSILFRTTAFLPERKYCFFGSSYVVAIENRMYPEPKEPLRVNCRSKDEDIGNHTITTGCATYHPRICARFGWAFCDSWFSRTRYFCDFWWGEKHLAIDVFSSDMGFDCEGGYCVWAANEESLYFASDHDVWVKKLDW